MSKNLIPSNAQLIRPAHQGGDVAHAAVKAALSAIPGVGGPAAELFQLIIQLPIEKRRDAFLASLAERLFRLEAQGLKVSALKDRPEFVTAFLQATQVALRTHEAEKLEALRNAVENVARGQSPDDVLRD